MKLPEIKLEPYYMCLFASNMKLESAYTSMSLAFDFCAFIAIVVLAYRSLSPSSVKELKLTGVVGTVLRDGTFYFAVIFTLHLTLTMFIFFARVRRIVPSRMQPHTYLWTFDKTGEFEVDACGVSSFLIYPRAIFRWG